MNLNKDYQFHLGIGCAVVLSTLAILWIASHYGPGAAAAFATSLLGIAYERVQAFREEGEASWRDAAFTAVPGWIFWFFYWAGV